MHDDGFTPIPLLVFADIIDVRDFPPTLRFPTYSSASSYTPKDQQPTATREALEGYLHKPVLCSEWGETTIGVVSHVGDTTFQLLRFRDGSHGSVDLDIADAGPIATPVFNPEFDHEEQPVRAMEAYRRFSVLVESTVVEGSTVTLNLNFYGNTHMSFSDAAGALGLIAQPLRDTFDHFEGREEPIAVLLHDALQAHEDDDHAAFESVSEQVIASFTSTVPVEDECIELAEDVQLDLDRMPDADVEALVKSDAWPRITITVTVTDPKYLAHLVDCRPFVPPLF